MKRFLVALPLFWIGFAFGQQDGLKDIVLPGAKLEKLDGSSLFTEGPTADSKGNVYFTDQPNDRIMEWSIDDKLSTFMQPCGRSNGMVFDKKGNLWTCADEKNEIWCIAPDKKIMVIPSKYQDKVLNGPNDIWVASNGGVYFTDPFYKRTWWDHSDKPQDIQGVYYISPDYKTITRVVDDMVQPNGIVGTPDGKTLFIADIGGRKTWKYVINKDFSLGQKTLFCETGSDGMTIDTKGNIYLCGRGVTIFDKTGKQIGNIAIPEGQTTNVCFGGRDMKSLFITAGKGLYRLKMKVKGSMQ
jgi:gluconolactonase